MKLSNHVHVQFFLKFKKSKVHFPWENCLRFGASATEMSQAVNCLPHRQDLSSGPQHSCQKLGLGRGGLLSKQLSLQPVSHLFADVG